MFVDYGLFAQKQLLFCFVPGMLVFAVTVDVARVDSAVIVMV